MQRILEAHGAIARGEAGAQDELERLQAEFRTSGAMIERPGGSATLIERPRVTKTRRPIARSKTATAESLPFGHPPEAVEIRMHSTEPERFRVGLSSQVKRDI